MGWQGTPDGSGAPDRSLLELVIQTAPDAIVTADAHGTILSFSPAAERIFGYTEAELVGRNVDCLMPEPHRSQHDGYMAQYMKTGERRIIGIGREVQARRKNGEIFVAELAIGELQHGALHIFTGFIRDVSDRLAAEGHVRELQRTLEKVSRLQLLGEMSTVLAHEINQPLTAISNFAHAARRLVGDEGGRIAEHLEAIAEQAIRAGEIIKRMRLMVDRGRADIRPDDINDILEEAVRVGRAGTEHRGPEVVLELAPALPRVMADRVQIQQVVINLIQNAFEAMAAHAPDPVHVASGRVALRAGANHAEVEVTVSDTGPGFTPASLGRMFEPLFTTREGGLGIGLAICRTIVEAHGGRIWGVNLEGGGAAVHFTLPVADAR